LGFGFWVCFGFFVGFWFWGLGGWFGGCLLGAGIIYVLVLGLMGIVVFVFVFVLILILLGLDLGRIGFWVFGDWLAVLCLWAG